MDQTLIEMDKISVDETRDLLMSVLFVMKHLDRGTYTWIFMSSMIMHDAVVGC